MENQNNKPKEGLCDDWEYINHDMTEGEWAEVWKEFIELEEMCSYKIGDIVDYYGRRCRIMDDSGVDPISNEWVYLIETFDDNGQKFTWWVVERDLTPWTKGKTKCECGALYAKGWENFHALWCPQHRENV